MSVHYASVIKTVAASQKTFTTNQQYQPLPYSCCAVRRTENLEKYADELVQALLKVGWCMLDNFLTVEQAKTVDSDFDRLYQFPGSFKDAESVEPLQHKKYRTDKIHWFDSSEPVSQLRGFQVLSKAFDRLLKHVIKKLREQTFHADITRKSTIQVSYFPKDSFGYKCHTDNPNNNGRLLCVKYFINKEYAKSHGGASRFYNSEAFTSVDVDPKFNRAVIYWSDKRIFHQVLPCQSIIRSLTAWYFGTFVLRKPSSCFARKEIKSTNNIWKKNEEKRIYVMQQLQQKFLDKQTNFTVVGTKRRQESVFIPSTKGPVRLLGETTIH